MISYVTLGTNDFSRASAFYDALLGEMGAKRFETSEGFVFWGKQRSRGMLAVYKPYDGKPAAPGNGHMIALGVRGRDLVQRMHRAALSLGASDEGAPGNRGAEFYGAYFRDLDGNKICVFTYEGAAPSTDPA
jgi:catechol 2,3-dioxygenase-like lactoylglutathione lyase family enzyme